MRGGVQLNSATPNRVLVTNNDKYIVNSAISDNELYRLHGINVNIQDEFDKHYLKFYSSDSILTNTDSLSTIVQKMPDMSMTVVWINDNTTFGKEVRQQMKNNVYGYMFIIRPNDDNNTTVYFTLVSHILTGVFMKSYTTINNAGWSPYWKSIDFTNVNVE